jgi:undecaprenyl-diphosphatase
LLRLTAGSLKFRMNEETSFLLKIIVSMIPVGFVGILLKEPVERLFSGNIVFVGLMLLVTAALLAIAHFVRKREREIGYLDALIIGIAQAFAVIPGISRSGATISAGLIIGNSKNEIARFSFLMVLIPVIGANLLEILTSPANIAGNKAMVIVAGFVSAFISGYIACRWMIELVRKSRLIWFSIYCAIAGLMSVFLG